MTTFTKNELLGICALVTENRDSAKLQRISKISYTESINLRTKILEMLDNMDKQKWLEKQKDNYDISYDYDSQKMVIQDNINDIEYRIDSNLVDNQIIVPYYIENAEDYADELERIMIPQARSESDKELMREDLETLRNTDEEYVFGNYGTNGFITKESDIEEFNKICREMIESYQELCYSVKVFDIKWDTEDVNFKNEDGTPKEIEKHYWILPTDLEATNLEEAKEEIEEIISERLSDDEGFCHDGFKVDIKLPVDKACAEYLIDKSDEENS
ncbi:hypothetical protein ACOL3H_11910 [Aliarcobacter butzleri]